MGIFKIEKVKAISSIIQALRHCLYLNVLQSPSIYKGAMLEGP